MNIEKTLEKIFSYDIVSVAVPISELERIAKIDDYNSQFKAVLDISRVITTEDKDVQDLSDRFFELNIAVHGVDNAFSEFQIGAFLDCQNKSSRYKTRFLIVDLGTTFVYVPFRVQDSIGLRVAGKKPFFMTYGIVSTDCLKETENKVTEALIKISLFSMIQRQATEGEKPYQFNFYATVSDFENMKRSHWRSAHGINKLNERVQVLTFDRSELSDSNIEDMRLLCKEWYIDRLKVKNPEKGKFEDYYLMDLKKQDNLRYILFYMDNILVGYSIVIALDTYYYVKGFKPLSSMDDKYMEDRGIDEYWIHYLKSNLCNFMIYKIDEYVIGELGADFVAIGGKIDGLKKGENNHQDLMGYKKRLFKHCTPLIKAPLLLDKTS